MNARGNWLRPFTLVVLVFLACGRLTASETAGPNGGHRTTARPWYQDPAWQIGGGVAAGVVLLAGVVRLLSRNGDRRLAALRADLEERLLRDGLESPLTVADDVRAVSSMVENAVARLTAENATLRFLSDHHPDGFVLLDRSGVVSRANPAALRLLGGTERDVPGQRLDRWLSPREPGDVLATLLDRAGARTPAVRDSELAATSGTRRLVRVSAWSLSDAGHEGFAVLLHDLTEQTQARESLRRYELVFQHISDAVILTDLESRIIDWNPAATRTFGHERQDVLGRTTELLSHVQNRQLVTTQIISGVMSQGRWSGEIPFVRRDGSAGVSESVVVPLLDANGRRVATVGVHRDVTGRKRVEERLRESEARYRLLAEQASDMLARQSLRGTYLDVSPACRVMLGYEPEELIGRDPSELLHAADESTVRTSQRALVNTGDVQSVIYRMRRKDGSFVWVETRSQLTRNTTRSAGPWADEGQEIISVTRDVTVRKRTEQRLALQYETARILAEQGGIAEAAPRLLEVLCRTLDWQLGELWLVDPDRGLLRRVCAWHPHSELLSDFNTSSRSLAFRPGEGFAGLVWERATSTWIEDVLRDSKHFNPEGQAAVARLHGAIGFPIVDRGRPIGVMTFFSRQILPPDQGLLDMMSAVGAQVGQFLQRKQAEEQLAFQRVLLQCQTEAALDGILIVGPDGGWLLHNRRFLELWSIPPEVAEARDLRKALELMGSQAASDAQPDERTWARTSPHGETHDEVELSGDRTFDRYSAPVVDPDGTHHGRVWFYRDITERKRAEKELVERARKLRAAMASAESASRAKSEFLANMSHEVRTPMTAVLGYADMLLDAGLGPTDRVAAVQAIRGNGEHLLDVINDILDLSKIEAGKMEMTPEPCRLEQAIAEVLSSVEVQAHEKGLSLGFVPVGRLPGVIHVDPKRFRQILLNLVGNAVKFTDAGHIKVRLRLEEGTTDAAGWLCVDVEDEGIGIPAEQMGRLFEPFCQVDGSLTRKYGGTGLGLSICRRLAEAMGGAIGVRSEPGAGSCFTLRLPFDPAGAEWFEGEGWACVGVLGEPTPAGAGPRTLAGHVLLAEDNRDNQRILRYFIEGMGLRLTTVENGQRAVERARQEAFDVILMDMQMPGLDGYGATALLREGGLRTPIVALTAHAMRGDEARCLRAGCTAYLTKPVDAERLAEVLARYLPSGEETADESGVLRSTLSEDGGLAGLIAEYVAALPEEVADLRAAHTAGDRKLVVSRAHSIRGAGGMYGFPAISETAGRLEEEARGATPDEILGERIAALEVIVRRIERGLQRAS